MFSSLSVAGGRIIPMPPRRRAAAPIPIDIEAVRRKLAEGKIVRVGISRSAQFPDGGTGRVRYVGDPAVDGEEFVQVELSLNGTKDVLPFTPADLTPATRGRPPAATSTAAGSSAFPPHRPVSSPPVGPQAATADVGMSVPTTGPDNPNRVGPGSPAPVQPAVPRPKTVRGARRPPAVSISIATTDADPAQWRIEARVGARVVLRAGAVSPVRVWELVRLLDDDTLTRAVGAILDEQRRAAQARADQLSAELAQVRAELEALPGGVE
jgi:hypothetical protein